MKHFIMGIALALALVMGIAAFAETAEPANEPAPAVTEQAAAEDAAEAPETPAAEEADDDAAFREAMEAYRSAKMSDRVDELTEELNGYVEAGKMTQEQADLILDRVKDRMAVNNGTCPNCGDQCRNGGSRMGGRKGSFGGKGLFGGRMNGRMFGRMFGGRQQFSGR